MILTSTGNFVTCHMPKWEESCCSGSVSQEWTVYGFFGVAYCINCTNMPCKGYSGKQGPLSNLIVLEGSFKHATCSYHDSKCIEICQPIFQIYTVYYKWESAYVLFNKSLSPWMDRWGLTSVPARLEWLLTGHVDIFMTQKHRLKNPMTRPPSACRWGQIKEPAR